MDSDPEQLRLFLAGDVMTGRGVDQIQRHPGKPELREGYLHSARQYVELAARVHGPVPTSVSPSYIWGDALAVLKRWMPQRSIVNLETSITTSSDFWEDKPVHYRMHPRNIDCLKVAGIDLCVVANNHLLDFGRRGLLETLEVLQAAGIAVTGAGRNLAEASQPACLDIGEGASLWVFGIGSESSGIPGAWAAGPSRSGVYLTPDLSRESADDIAEQVLSFKGPRDLAIASIHWGSNWGYEIPNDQIGFARRLIDRGVDLVHGHSSHHPRPMEIYRGKLILYGCGDLVTDYEGIGGPHTQWRGDLGAMYFPTLSRRDGRLLGLRLVPMQMHKLQLVLAKRADLQWLTATLNRISGPLGSHFEEDDEGIYLQSLPAA